MATDTVNVEEEGVAIFPFTIEIDHPQNGDVIVQCIPGARLRSRTKPTITNVDGQVRTPQVKNMSVPELPGMTLSVHPEKCLYEISDPLNTDENAKERLERFLRNTGMLDRTTRVKGEDTVRGQLDVNRMKSLCREVIHLLDEGVARLTKGPKFDLDDVNDLPGKYLRNPGSRVNNTQPVYEEDYDQWINQLTRSGG